MYGSGEMNMCSGLQVCQWKPAILLLNIQGGKAVQWSHCLGATVVAPNWAHWSGSQRFSDIGPMPMMHTDVSMYFYSDGKRGYNFPGLTIQYLCHPIKCWGATPAGAMEVIPGVKMNIIDRIKPKETHFYNSINYVRSGHRLLSASWTWWVSAPRFSSIITW